ncbi:uncharacterized protein LOC110681645 [Chenopodium quinoa]|uniref:uncharacterized protein LOC110681645 n=1 Tax=Chenopodium quinoa TaxID=63459 RepID=UPI000B77EDF9|nr:uncharacterized protein LOC110681645 [Chenopodium quinoa]
MLLSQEKHAQEILERAGIASCKPAATPVDTKSKLSAGAGPPFRDPTLYRSLAGALQYLTFTRPDISYTVQQGTIDHGLHLYPTVSHRLITYTDADWGVVPTLDVPHWATVVSSGTTSYLGHLSVNIHYLSRLQKQNIEVSQMLSLRRVGSVIFY